MSFLIQILKHPATIVASIALGIFLGQQFPSFSLSLSPIADVYISLLKMIALPLMITAVIFSISRLMSDGEAPVLMRRFLLMFALVIPFAILVSLTTSVVLTPGKVITPEAQAALGSLIGADNISDTTSVEFFRESVSEDNAELLSILMSIVPNNIFASLSNGDALPVLIFALIFGASLGSVSARLKGTLTAVLESVYRSCLLMTSWLVVPLPIALIASLSSQLATSGIQPLLLMGEFLMALAVSSIFVLIIATIVIWIRSGANFSAVINSLQMPFAVALATRNSIASMPPMMEALEKLNFPKLQVELMVPLSISLARIGPTMFYVTATLFIAELYGRDLALADFFLVGFACFLAGMASAGATGVVALSMISISCGYLQLPFEAVLILFIAVDVISDTLRTLVLVIGNMAFSSLVCPRPLRI
jgi:Na+/H+-dicarboxylate symporter